MTEKFGKLALELLQAWKTYLKAPFEGGITVAEKIAEQVGSNR
ncbi:MAG: hypothetical protein R2771_13510 [Saprospiraceae bacterium]